VSSVLQDWQTQAQTEALARAAAAYGVPSHFVPRHTLSTLLGQVGAAQFVTTQPTVGPVKDWLDQQKLPMAYVCRDWDKAAYPHASKGFFQFKEKIPALVAGW
jgi:deoxyribodipyrimidine photo-lyase